MNNQIQERNVSFGKIGTIFKKKIDNNLFFNIRTLIFMNDILLQGRVIDTDININLALGIFPSPMSKYYKSGMLLNIDDCLNMKRMFDAFKAGKINEIVYKKDSKIFKGDAQVTEVINFGIQKANNNGGFWARVGSFNPHTNEHYDFYDFQIYANDIVRLSNIISSFESMYNNMYFQIAGELALQELRNVSNDSTHRDVSDNYDSGFYGNSGFQTSGTYNRTNNPQQVQNDPTVKNTDILKKYNQQYNNPNCDVNGDVQECTQPNNGLGLNIDFTSNLPNINEAPQPNINEAPQPNINEAPQPNINEAPQPNINSILTDVSGFMCGSSEPTEEVVESTANPMGGVIEKVQKVETVKQEVQKAETVKQEVQKAETIINHHIDTKKYQYVYTDETNKLIQAFTNSLGCEEEINEYGTRYILPFFPSVDNSFSIVRQLSNNIGNFGISAYVFDPNLYFIFTLHIQYMLGEMKGKIETNAKLNESDFDPVEIKGLYLIFMNWFKIIDRVKGDDIIFNSDEVEIGERLIQMFETFIESKSVRDKCYDSVFLQELITN